MKFAVNLKVTLSSAALDQLHEAPHRLGFIVNRDCDAEIVVI